MKSIICPISKEKVDNNQSRATVFISVIFMMVFIYTKNPALLVIATADTFIRAVFHPRYSPMGMIASGILNVLNRQVKKIDLSKKQFASRLGMLCGVTSILLFYLDLELASLTIAVFWMSLAILDSVFDFCLGCIIYTYVVFPFYMKK
ncbi:DUF4395 domain-containing protein [Maribacter sp. 2307UL18-2]|uniref:DUF4395 domain-containing protein n=1 Tax=Maribacter sp. 2307UL18-2 TaxID=3386274 RepID=UPI0039BC36DE